MIFGSIEVRCVLDVLRILNSGKSKYSLMFRKTKVSHTTLQRSLKKLISKRLVKRMDLGHINVDYEITRKGKELLIVLEKLKMF